MLRAGVACLGVLLLAAAAGIILIGWPRPLALDLAIGGLIIMGSVVIERYVYRPTIDRRRGRWEQTGERFVDATTGRLIEVYYNPDTGQRDYRDVGPAQPAGESRR